MALPSAFGVASYNNVQLDGIFVSSTVSVEPVDDPSGRGVMFDRITVGFSGYLAINDDRGILVGGNDYADLDDAINDIRQRLSEYGKPFQYEGRGLGAFEVNNGSGTLDDLDFGPRPGPLTLAPVGAEKCLEFEWSLTTAVARCTTGGVNLLGEIIGWSYSVVWSITDGFVTRTVTGSARIATALDDQGRARHTADAVRDQLVPEIPDDNFRRDFVWSLDERHTTMSYTVTDDELEGDNGLPAGVRKADVRFSTVANTGMLQAGSERVFHRACTISGTMRVAKPFPLATAWERMILVIVGKMSKARQKGNFPLLTSILISEALFGREVSFGVEYIVVLGGERTPASIIGGTLSDVGMFAPVTETSHAAWARSMEAGPHHPRGNLRLTHSTEGDQVIDVCEPSKRTPGTVKDTLGSGSGSVGGGGLLSADCPPKKYSYLLYRNDVAFDAIGGAITAVEQAIDTGLRGLPDEYVKAGNVIIGQLPGASQAVAATDAILSYVGQTMTTITMRGMAARLCWQPEVPVLGDDLLAYIEKITQRSQIVRGKVASFGAMPVFGMKWRITYRTVKPLDQQFISLLAKFERGSETAEAGAIGPKGQP